VRPRDVISFNRAAFVGGPAIGLGAILAAGTIDAVPAPVRIAIGLAGAAAIAMTGSALFATWRVFGRDAPARWAWIAHVAAGSNRWLNLTTGFDDSTERLRTTVPGAGTALDVFDPDRSHDPALRTARAAFPPRGVAVPVGALSTAVELGPVDVVFLLMSAHETHGAERIGLLSAARQALAPGGRVVLVEHLRDRANILAFGPGAWHFSRRDDWLRSAAAANLELVDKVRLSPLVAGLVFMGRSR
jgi:hypothetical protein